MSYLLSKKIEQVKNLLTSIDNYVNEDNEMKNNIKRRNRINQIDLFHKAKSKFEENGCIKIPDNLKMLDLCNKTSTYNEGNTQLNSINQNNKILPPHSKNYNNKFPCKDKSQFEDCQILNQEQNKSELNVSLNEELILTTEKIERILKVFEENQIADLFKIFNYSKLNYDSDDDFSVCDMKTEVGRNIFSYEIFLLQYLKVLIQFRYDFDEIEKESQNKFKIIENNYQIYLLQRLFNIIIF